jgi:hypothetical protein
MKETKKRWGVGAASQREWEEKRGGGEEEKPAVAISTTNNDMSLLARWFDCWRFTSPLSHSREIHTSKKKMLQTFFFCFRFLFLF